MAEVLPFKGVLFNRQKLPDVPGEDLVAPPYDIVTPEYQDELYQRSPHNIIRIDFGKDLPGDDETENRYTRAKAWIQEWIRDRVLAPSLQPCFYLYEIEYALGGEKRRLRGVLGLVRIEEIGKGSIYPHECTYSKPKKDRLTLMRTCEANISPIFSLYHSPERKTSRLLEERDRGLPYLEAKDRDGAAHRLWEIGDPAEIALIREELAGRPVFIADGHHRYETAFEYHREMQEREGDGGKPRPSDYVLMFLANIADRNLTVLPTHRLVTRIPQNPLELLSHDFEIETVEGAFDIAAMIAGERNVFGFYLGGDVWYRLRYRGSGIPGLHPCMSRLDVAILDDLVLNRLLAGNEIGYEMDVGLCLQKVKERSFEAAFFLNPTPIEDVEAVALSGQRMPPKSTYFYPKLLTGFVLNIFHYSF